MAYLTSGETPTTRMFAVLPDTSVAGGDVATVLSSLGQACRHFLAVVVDIESINVNGNVLQKRS